MKRSMSAMSQKHPGRLRIGQAGMASILITMITMIVVSLIVLGYATISRREQGNTLDQQLSTQAFYAAESGIADARNVIQNDIRSNKPVLPKTNCTGNSGGATYPTPVGNKTTLDQAHNVSYTCLLVTPVTSAKYDGVGAASWVIPITSVTPMTSITINWTPTNNTSPSAANCATSTIRSFKPSTAWNCDFGLLRMDLVPTQGALSRNTLASNDLPAFLEPFKTAVRGNLLYSAATKDKPNIVPASCGTSCTVTIQGLPSSKDYGLRIESLYQTSDLTITAYTGSTKVTLSSQVSVDATGDAGGVLRRIQAMVPTTATSNLIPGAAFQTNGAVCKRFEVTPTYFNIAAGSIVSPDSNNGLCEPETGGSL